MTVRERHREMERPRQRLGEGDRVWRDFEGRAR